MAAAGSALATPTTTCTTTMTGVAVGDVVVPPGASCTLVNSTVDGNATAESGAYLELDFTTVTGDVQGLSAETVFVNDGSSVGGSVIGKSTQQMLVFNAKVTRGISIDSAANEAEVCGTTVSQGNVSITNGERLVLFGDPIPSADCAGNTVSSGNVKVSANKIFDQLVVADNTVSTGNLEVTRNTGPAEKVVRYNNGGNNLRCMNNTAFFSGASNGAWAGKFGQCS
jgi:hypothetical protein